MSLGVGVALAIYSSSRGCVTPAEAVGAACAIRPWGPTVTLMVAAPILPRKIVICLTNSNADSFLVFCVLIIRLPLIMATTSSSDATTEVNDIANASAGTSSRVVGDPGLGCVRECYFTLSTSC